MNRPQISVLLAAIAVVAITFSVAAPAHAGPNFKNAGIADFARQKVAEANDAVIDCDQEAFQRAVDAIDDTADDREGYATSNPNEQAQSIMGSTEDATADARTLRAIQARLQREWAAAQPCNPDPIEENTAGAINDNSTPIPDKKPAVKVSGGVKTGIIKPESASYLGKRPNSTDVFGLAIGNNRLNMTGLGVQAEWELAILFNAFNAGYNVFNIANTYNLYNSVRMSPLRLITGFETVKADINQSFNQIDPDSTLLIPGVGVGPNGAGFSLAAGVNQVDNAFFDSKFSWHEFIFGFAADVQAPNSNVTVTPSVALRYGHSTTKNTFGGRVTGFARDLQYDTKMEVQSFSPTLGVDVKWRVDPVVELFAGGWISYDFNDADGTDTLQFTGFADQTANMSTNKDTHSHAVKAGVNITPNLPVSFTLEGTYEQRGNVPVLNTRDGVNTSDFRLDDADVFTGVLRTTFTF